MDTVIISLNGIIMIILDIICLLLAIWQKTVVFSGLCAFVSATSLYIGFVILHCGILFYPIPAVLTIVSLMMCLYETLNGDVL